MIMPGLAALPAEELARKMCLQLDAMFGSAQNANPCSKACTGFLVQDWSKEPLAKGAYSHPSLGAYGKRDALSTAAGQLYFAGEATQEGINPCVQGGTPLCCLYVCVCVRARASHR